MSLDLKSHGKPLERSEICHCKKDSFKLKSGEMLLDCNKKGLKAVIIAKDSAPKYYL